YIDGNWKTSWILGETDQGKPAALVSNISSILFVPIDGDGDGAGGTTATGAAIGDTLLSFTGRALVPKQRLSIFVNEKAVSTLEIDTANKRYDVNVPAGVFKAGENRVRLTFRSAAPVAGGKRSAAAISSVTVGPATAAPPPATTVPVTVQDTTFGASRRRALTLAGAPRGGRVSYYLQLPEGARLALAYGSKAPGASVLVRVAVDGKPARTVHQGAVGSAWTDASIDLGARAGGGACRIDLVSRGGEVAWAAPRLLVKAPAPVAAPTTPRFDRIYVWMIDTLRADKVRVYNPKTRLETPNIDAFAADATRFEWAQVPGTWSLPSHASLLTGVYPVVHGAVAHEARLSKTVPFVAEDMKKAGYRTAIFSSNGYVSAKWGFERGWDMYRNFIRESLPNGADYLWKTAKPWLFANLKKPTFAYLATVDPHVVYNPKKEFLAKYWPKPYKGPIKPAISGVQMGFIKAGKLKINDNDKAYLEALHDAEITQSDAAFKVFIDDLKAAGIYETTAIIVVSDHGDEFYEHGSLGHGHTVYQELVRVPLIIRAPGLYPRGKVVHADVEVMDLYPTMLELAGIKPPPGTTGATLTPLPYDEIGTSPRAALTIDGGVARGLKVERYRLVLAGKVELFDEYEDRREQQNVATERPIAFRHMRNIFSLLHQHEHNWNKARWGTAANVTDSINKDIGLDGHLAGERQAQTPTSR
ncbi:MAG TPA: sulfatase, partial [Polyangia bacterium]|nr:sulfatase [Polyangia bacterium]